ncbi:MAG: helix-turn-helix domain-containing protein [Acidimicrobiales bacterium]
MKKIPRTAKYRQQINDALDVVEQIGPRLEPTNVGQRIRELRQELNREEPFSQTELARRSDIDRRRLNSFEKNGRDELIRLPELVTITERLGVPTDTPWRRKSKPGLSSLASISDVIHGALSLKPTNIVGASLIDDLTTLCEEAERLFADDKFARLEYLLERLLPAALGSSGDTVKVQSDLKRLNGRLMTLCRQLLELNNHRRKILLEAVTARQRVLGGAS